MKPFRLIAAFLTLGLTVGTIKASGSGVDLATLIAFLSNPEFPNVAFSSPPAIPALVGPLTITDTTASAAEFSGLTVTDTRTGAGAVGWAAKFDLETNIAAGAYLNGAYGYLAFGASGRITGLASGTVGEIVLSAGCTQGTYACFEAEMGMPANAVTGTAASFMYLSLYGAGAAAFDTSGYLFQLAGVTKAGGKLLQDTTSGATIRPVQVLKVLTPDGVRYLPLYITAAIAA